MYPEQVDGGTLALQAKRLLQQHQQKDQQLNPRRTSVPVHNNMLWHHRRAAIFYEEQKLKKQLDSLEFEERESKIKLRNMERELRSDLRRMQLELRIRAMSRATNEGLRLPTGIVVTDEHGDDCQVEFLSLDRTAVSREPQVPLVGSCLDAMRLSPVRQQRPQRPQYVLPCSPVSMSSEVSTDNLSENVCKSSPRHKTKGHLRTISDYREEEYRSMSTSMSKRASCLDVPSPDVPQSSSSGADMALESLNFSPSGTEHIQTEASGKGENTRTSFTPFITELHNNVIPRMPSSKSSSEKSYASTEENSLKLNRTTNLSEGVKCRVKRWLQKSREKERDLVRSRAETRQKAAQGHVVVSPAALRSHDSDGQKIRLPNVFERLSQGHLKTRRPPLPRRSIKYDLERNVASAWEQARKCRYIRNYVPPDRRGRFPT